ncbi:MAG: multidrug transporter subunit MdtN [Alcaligenaceae bacterium]|nr:multidrug transporter subunit MdtN [Alcaligenaceae bacterium]
MADRKAGSLFAALIIGVTLLVVVAWWRHLDRNLVSEEAVLQADVVHVSSPVPGRMVELAVREGDRVAQNDLLFRLDPEAYELRVQQAEAELAVARAALSTRERQIRAETANADIANEQIERARANLALASSTVERLEPLARKGYVTRQELDTARTARRDAQVSLNQALSQSEAARALVGELEAAQAALEVAEVAVALARKALRDTEVRAPHQGLVVGLRVATGEYMAPDQPVFTLIDTRRWYATALFRETELTDLRVGQCAQAFAMAQPDREMQGRVESIGWGVLSEDLVALPRALPYVQKSLNWVRVAQRFPVRILLENPPPDLMRAGASASVVVRAGTDCP